jgi:hypothetical protein
MNKAQFERILKSLGPQDGWTKGSGLIDLQNLSAGVVYYKNKRARGRLPKINDPEVIAYIRTSKEPATVLAPKVGCKPHTIRAIRNRTGPYANH